MNQSQAPIGVFDSGVGGLSVLREIRQLLPNETLLYVADSGHVKTRGFCPTCGSPVYMTFSAMPEFFSVRAASLDDPSRYRPQAVTYAVRGLAWDRLDPDLQKFSRMPTE